MVIQLFKYVTHIIGEPKYKYGQPEQKTVWNQQKYRLEMASIEILGRGGGGGLKPVLRVPKVKGELILFVSFCAPVFLYSLIQNVISLRNLQNLFSIFDN